MFFALLAADLLSLVWRVREAHASAVVLAAGVVGLMGLGEEQ
jgi:hypothetical protein